MNTKHFLYSLALTAFIGAMTLSSLLMAAEFKKNDQAIVTTKKALFVGKGKARVVVNVGDKVVVLKVKGTLLRIKRLDDGAIGAIKAKYVRPVPAQPETPELAAEKSPAEPAQKEASPTAPSSATEQKPTPAPEPASGQEQLPETTGSEKPPVPENAQPEADQATESTDLPTTQSDEAKAAVKTEPEKEPSQASTTSEHFPTSDAAPVEKADNKKAEPRSPARVLVTNFTAQGVEDSLAKEASQAAALAFEGRQEAVAVTMSDLKEMVKMDKSKTAMGCGDDGACLAKISSWADADLAMRGVIGRVGETLTITLSLVDTQEMKVINRVSVNLDNKDEVIERTVALIPVLFGWANEKTGPRFKLAAGEKVSFAVFELHTAGLSKELAANLTQILSVEIKKIEGTSVISRDDIAALIDLDAEKTMLGCTSDTGCLAEIGAALGVDKLVVGQIGKLADKYVVSLRLLDTETVKAESRVIETFSGEEKQLIGAVRHAGRRLLGVGEGATGTMSVTANQEEVEVFVDEVSVGVLPFPPLQDLAAGRHDVRVTKSGFYDWQTTVYVNPADNASVWAELVKRPTPWYKTWWFWSLSGASAIGIISGGVIIGIVASSVPATDLGNYGAQ